MPLNRQQKPDIATTRTNVVIVCLAVAVVLSGVLGIAGVALQMYLANRRAEGEHQARNKVQMERERAEEQTLQARRNLYVSDLLLAEAALEENHVGRCRELLERHRPKLGEQDLRGWEWRYLWGRCQSDAFLTLDGHSNLIYSVTFSPDGLRLASSSMDRTHRVWNLSSTQMVAAPNRLGEHPNAIRFSADGMRIFTSSVREGMVRVWDSSTMQPLGEWPSGAARLGPLSLSPDGKTLASLSDKQVLLWSTVDDRRIQFQGPTNVSRYGQLAFSANGQLLAVSAPSGDIHIWDVGADKLLTTLAGHKRTLTRNDTEVVVSLVFTLDAGQLVSSGVDRTVRVWDIRSGHELRRLEAHSSFVNAVSLSPDGHLLATAGSDQTIRLWRTTDWEVARVLRGHESEVWAVAFSPDGQTLASGGRDETIKLWRVAASGGPGPALALPNDVNSYHLTPDGHRLVLTYTNNTFTVIDTTDWKSSEPVPLNLPKDPQRQLASSPDAGLLVSSTSNGPLTTFDVATASGRPSFRGHTSTTDSSPVFSADGLRMVSANADFTVRVWDVPNRSLIAKISLPRVFWASLDMSRDGNVVAVGGNLGRIDVWNIETNRPWTILNAHKATVSGLRFLAKTPELISVGNDGDVKIWDLVQRREMHSFPGSIQGLKSLCVSPDERLLAVASRDGIVTLWDLQLRQELVTLKGHSSEVRELAFSRDGNTLVTASLDSVRKWHAPPWIEISEIEKQIAVKHWANWPPNAEQPSTGAIESRLVEKGILTLAEASLRPRTIEAEPVLSNVSWTVPRRPVGASNNLIDLSASYNAPLDQGWIPPLTAARVATNNLRLLGHGIQVLGGVPFDVRGLIQLSGDVMKERHASFPDAVRGIAVNLRGTKLHVLHAAVWDVPAGTIIGKYVVHYSDGQDEELFIRYDVDISGWTIAPGTATGAQQVWEEGQWEKSRRLFLKTYPLRQDAPIQSIDFVARKTRAAPFVVAMTVE